MAGHDDPGASTVGGPWLLRRVPADKYSPDSEQPCSPVAFMPGPRDETGISFFRESSRTPESLAGRPDKPTYVVRVHEAEVRQLGLTVRDCGSPGHVEIPEIQVSMMRDRAKKQWVREKTLELAVLASRPEALAFPR